MRCLGTKRDPPCSLLLQTDRPKCALLEPRIKVYFKCPRGRGSPQDLRPWYLECWLQRFGIFTRYLGEPLRCGIVACSGGDSPSSRPKVRGSRYPSTAHLSLLSARSCRTCGPFHAFPKAPLFAYTFHNQLSSNIYFLVVIRAVAQLSARLLFLNVFISLLPRRRYLKRYTYRGTPRRCGTRSVCRIYSLGSYLEVSAISSPDYTQAEVVK